MRHRRRTAGVTTVLAVRRYPGGVTQPLHGLGIDFRVDTERPMERGSRSSRTTTVATTDRAALTVPSSSDRRRCRSSPFLRSPLAQPTAQRSQPLGPPFGGFVRPPDRLRRRRCNRGRHNRRRRRCHCRRNSLSGNSRTAARGWVLFGLFCFIWNIYFR